VPTEKKSALEHGRVSIAKWFAGLSNPGLIGVGLAFGFLVSAVLVLALRSRVDDLRPTSARARVELPPPAPAGSREPVGLAAIMNGVRRTASSTDWRRTGWPDPLLIRAIDDVLAEIRRATGDATIGSPVRFDDVWPKLEVGYGPDGRASNPTGVLHVASGPPRSDGPRNLLAPAVLRDHVASRAILIAHGDIELGHAQDCLIVATGAVDVAFTTHCVIFAGRVIHVTGDSGSLLISGSKLSMGGGGAMKSPYRRPVYSAPDDVYIGWPRDASLTLLNSRPPSGSRSARHYKEHYREVNWPALDLRSRDAEGNPLEGRFRFKPFAIRGQDYVGVDIRVRGVEGEARVVEGGSIVDPLGRPIPGLEGWIMYRVAHLYTMLSDGYRMIDLPIHYPLSNDF
jgi:hypothetical protein